MEDISPEWERESLLPTLVEDFDIGDRVYTWVFDKFERLVFGTVTRVSDDRIQIKPDKNPLITLEDDGITSLEDQVKRWHHGLQMKEVKVGSVISTVVATKMDFAYRRTAKVTEYLAEENALFPPRLSIQFLDSIPTEHTFEPDDWKEMSLEMVMRAWRLED